MNGAPAAWPIVSATMAEVFTPPMPMVPSAWAAEHLIVPDGPRAGGHWDRSLTPYVPAIIDELGPDSQHNMVAVRKSAQTGVSVAGLALVGAYIDLAPTQMAFALPTLDALQEFNRGKLGPVIEGTPVLRKRVYPQRSRSSGGSTVVSKRFRGGSLALLNANSASDLRSRTLKVGIGDEVDEWEQDLEGQGDPWDLFEGRFTAYHATGDWRMLAISTPTLAGSSRIEALFSRGDQRFWHVTCPGCRTEIRFEFKHLEYGVRPPYGALYATQCCGTIIEHHEKAALVRAGRFIATNPDGLYPSFHVDALVSLLTTWDKLAEAHRKAEGDERKLKAFYNLWLGLAYELRGDAPDYVGLYGRREAYPENRVPPLGLLLVAGADVQHSGIWVEVVAFAPDRRSWSLSHRFLEGDTTDAARGAFLKLQEVYDERFEDAWGNQRQIEAMAIDAGDGGRANQVYEFSRHRVRAYAVKGMPGWNRPAIGSPTKVHVTRLGKKTKASTSLWPIGTWDLKAEFYANLRKEGRRAGAEEDPPGYCHFGEFLDERYFRQITAESIAEKKFRGRSMKVWQDNGPNHSLDCRVYAMAMAEHLGLTRKNRDQWQALARRYQMPVAAGDLFAPMPLEVERIEPAAPPADVLAANEELTADFKRSIESKAPSAPVKRPRFARLSGRNRRG